MQCLQEVTRKRSLLLQPSALEQNIDKEAETADSVIMMAAPQHARKHYPMWRLEKTHRKWIMQEVLTAKKILFYKFKRTNVSDA